MLLVGCACESWRKAGPSKNNHVKYKTNERQGLIKMILVHVVVAWLHVWVSLHDIIIVCYLSYFFGTTISGIFSVMHALSIVLSPYTDYGHSYFYDNEHIFFSHVHKTLLVLIFILHGITSRLSKWSNNTGPSWVFSSLAYTKWPVIIQQSSQKIHKEIFSFNILFQVANNQHSFPSNWLPSVFSN